MNVFVLSTGRCGSTTFARACEHIENYSAAHESRISCVKNRVEYPDDHIEIDNHLAWFLGRLDGKYGDDAFYVHLKRDLGETARSRMEREEGKIDPGLMWAYGKRLIWENERASLLEVSEHYCKTVNENIRLFLKDKSMVMEFSLESAKSDFQRFWNLIGANGNFEKAVREWNQMYNATIPEIRTKKEGKKVKKRNNKVGRAINKTKRIIKKLPKFIKNA